MDHFLQFWYVPRRLFSALVLRVGLGLLAMLFFLDHYKERSFIWGPNGMADWHFYTRTPTHVSPADLYSLNGSQAWSEFLYWLSISVAVAFIVGFIPRLACILLYLLVFSAYLRSWVVLDGGHNILGLLLGYLCFADLRKHALFVPRPLSWLCTRLNLRSYRLLGAGDEVRTVLHNAAMTMVQLQLCMLYFWSAFYKITGHKWQDGTAVYYVMRTQEFNFPPYSEWIYSSAILVTVLTYCAILFQIAFPFLMWNRRVKPFLFLIAVLFHAGIAVFMGLVLFSMTMIVADMALFDDAALRGAYERFRRFASWSGLVRAPATQVDPA